MPKKAVTGTQSKAIKQLAHETRKGGKTREKAIKKTESFLHGGNRNVAMEKELKKTLGGIESYRHSDKYKSLNDFTPGGSAYKNAEDFSRMNDFGINGKGYKNTENFKGLKPFEYGGKSYQDPNFYKEGLQGYEMAQKVLAPAQAQAMRNFGQVTLPGIQNQLGSDSKGGSALRQALAASRENLERDLHAQTSQLAAQYGSDISRMNLGERGRQQELQQQTALQRAGLNIGQQGDIRNLQQMNESQRAQMNMAQQAQQNALQYGAASDIFNSKRAATLGLGDQQRSNLEYLNNLSAQAGFNLQNAGLAGLGGSFQPVHMQKGQSNGVSPVGGGIMGGLGGAASGAAIGSVVPGIGTAVGAGVGGLLGLFGGVASSR